MVFLTSRCVSTYGLAVEYSSHGQSCLSWFLFRVLDLNQIVEDSICVKTVC